NIFTLNKIGTDITGMYSLGTQSTGISLSSSGNIVGNDITDGNLISGTGWGLTIAGNNNVLRGNVIGLNSDNTAAISNGIGIYFTGGDNNEIGGTLPEHRNVFSGNTTGINMLFASNDNVIHGNYFGLTQDGLNTISNVWGLQVQGSGANNLIGGVFGEGTNYFAGNSTALYITTSGAGTLVQGNIFGLNINNEARPNTGRVIWYTSNAEATIGGPNSEDRNIFSGNSSNGIELTASAPHLTLTGNYFGTTPDGMEARPNTGNAIYTLTSDGTNTIISNNLISGSTEGIRLWNGTTNYRITGNKIGTNLTGDAAIPNGIGIRLNLGTTQDNIIGGYGADANIISGNTIDGIRFTDGANNNQVIGNYIGTTADGITPLPNGAYGIELQYRTVDNIIGGDNPEDGNIIANNLLGGVRMTWTVFTAPARNRITQNLIFNNCGLGIMLGTTASNLNDPVDADEGINRRQNYPVISESFNLDIDNDVLELAYYVPSDPTFSTYPIRVEFFADDSNRQGKQIIYVDEFTEDDYLLLRPKQLSIDISGLGLVSTDIPVATATDADGNTSEFGFIVPDPPVAADEEACSGYTATLTAAGASGTGVYRWYTALANVTPAFTGNPFTTPVLTATTTYYVAIFDNSHESVRIPVEVVVFDSPVITVTSLTSQTSCVEPNGIIELDFEFVPDGIYDIDYDGGTFTGVEVSGGQAVIIADIGLYSDLQITVDACTSLPGVNAQILDEIITPVITVTSINQQTSCLSANGSLELSFTNIPDGIYTITYDGGQFDDVNIIANAANVVADIGVYNDLQIDVGVCISPLGVNAEVLDMILIPEVIVDGTTAQTSCVVDNGEVRLSFINVPDGLYTITYDGGTFDDIEVTDNEAIIIANFGLFENIQITVGDCASALGIDVEINNAIVIPEMELSSVIDQTSCLADNGRINLSFNNVPDGLYDIVYSDGIFEDVAVSTGTASIVTGQGNYFNLFITLGDCQSLSAVSAVINDATSIPTLSLNSTTSQTSCQTPDGSITLSFTNVPDGIYDISFDGGSFNGIEVIAEEATIIVTAGTYNDLQITVGDCSSALGVTATVIDDIGIPVINVTDVVNQTSCIEENGSIIFSFENVPDGVYEIIHSSGSFQNVSIVAAQAAVTSISGSYNDLRIQVDDCVSASGVNVVINEVLDLPVIAVDNTTAQTDCLNPNGALYLSVSIVPDGFYNITYEGGEFTNIEIQSGQANLIAAAGTYNDLQIAFGNCTSAIGVNAEVESNLQALNPAIVQDEARCGTGVVTFTASGAQPGQSYAWYADINDAAMLQDDTGVFTTPVLTSTSVFYVVIIGAGGCSSDPAEVTAIINLLDAPEITGTNNLIKCPGGNVSLQGPSGFAAYLWSTGEDTMEIEVANEGTYTLIVFDNNGCESDVGSITVTLSNFPDIPIVFSEDRLQTIAGLQYQWYYFDDLIQGATQQFLQIDLLKYGIYRVQVTNQDACSVFSNPFEYLITSATETKQSELLIFPNPVKNELSMEIENDPSIKLWQVLDIAGNVILNTESVDVKNFDVTAWSAGLYFVYAKTNKGLIVRKLIKH
ncbi:MAG TPA: T9SS type A sorting domain-containing protein, partial [Cyclobacteriaceae bacterium]|nr:T9SS type A sorting domain-containing protein [Cyclobacteriaceae bacterium]